jgi:hypothetical protein
MYECGPWNVNKVELGERENRTTVFMDIKSRLMHNNSVFTFLNDPV